MGQIFKSEDVKLNVIEISNSILNSSSQSYTENFIQTSFGPTNIISTPIEDNKESLIILHGGSGNAAITAWLFDSLGKKFNLIIPDIIGGPGKSSEKFLNPQNGEYGEWLKEVIEKLSLKKVNVMAISQGSYPALRYLESYSSEINKLILYVPAAFVQPKLMTGIFKFFLPLMLYRLTNMKFFYNILEKSIFTKTPDFAISKYFQYIFLNTSFDMRQPKILNKAPSGTCPRTLFISADNDLFFEGKKVKKKAQSLFGSNTKTILLSNSNHSLTKSDQRFRQLMEEITEFVYE